MSSMGRKTIYSIALMAGTALVFPATAQAQEAGRSSLVAQQPGQMDQAVGQWEYLTARDDLPFASYAGFITSYPDFPKQELLQRRAEAVERVTTEHRSHPSEWQRTIVKPRGLALPEVRRLNHHVPRVGREK